MKTRKNKPISKRSRPATTKQRRIRRRASHKRQVAKQKSQKPSAKVEKFALMATEARDGIPSLPRLHQILGEYYQPVLDYEPIGNRVPFPTLTQRINDEWSLPGSRRFQNGEINPTTVVIALSEDIDSRATH